MPIAAFRHNNPFDVSLPIAGWKGGGNIVGINGQSGFGSFPDMDTGYAAGVQRLNSYISGQSSHGAKRNISELNSVYATDPNWAAGVAKHSGLGPNDELDVNNPEQMSKLQYGVLAQEIGPANAAAVFRNKHGADALGAINAAAGIKTSAPGALTSSFAPTESKSMPTPALSADETLGPGALNPQPDRMSIIGQSLTNMGASLAGISNPDQGKVLAAQAAAMQRQAVDPGTWSVQTMPDGSSFYFNNKTARRIPIGNFAKPQEDEYKKAAEIAGAKSYQDYGDTVAQQAANANGLATDVSELRRVFSNPAVYQGQGGELVQTARKLYAGITGDTEGAKNIADGDIAKALSNKLALRLVQDNGTGKLLPGSFSDSDRDFVKQMSTSLNNEPGANQRMLDIYDRIIARAQQAEEVRAAHLAANGDIYRPSVRSEIGKLSKQWAAEDKARNEAEAKAAAAAPAAAAKPGAAPKTNTFTSPSGKKINWSY